MVFKTTLLFSTKQQMKMNKQTIEMNETKERKRMIELLRMENTIARTNNKETREYIQGNTLEYLFFARLHGLRALL
jgi:hypothetical protein